MAHQTSSASGTSRTAARQWQSTPAVDGHAGVHWACALAPVLVPAPDPIPDSLVGHLNLLKPASGIEIETSGADRINLLGVQVAADAPLPAPLVDSWVRSSDAFAIYEPSDSRRLRTTTQWRLLDPPADGQSAAGEIVTIELVVSTQTSRVTSDGATAGICRLPAPGLRAGWFLDGELHWSEAEAIGSLQKAWANLPPTSICCLLCPASVAGGSLGILVRRDEARHLFLATDPAQHGDQITRLTTWFFPTQIEKGVLHRGRIRAILGRPDTNQHWIAAAAAVFAAEPPLLQ